MYRSQPPQDTIVVSDSSTWSSGTGTLTWAKSGLQYVDCSGCGHISIQTVGTYSLTQQYEVTNDLGATWLNVGMQTVASVPLAENNSVAGTAQSLYEVGVMGYRYFRIRISNYTSGSYSVYINGRAGSATRATQPVMAGQDGTWTVGINTAIPSGATSISASSGVVSNATATATLAGASGKTTYITGFSITASGATAASVVAPTVTNLIGGTATYTFVAIAGATNACPALIVNLTTPVPANATNTSIVVSCPALGAGNTNCTVNAFGFQL